MAELILSLKDRELSRHALGPVTRIGRDPECEVFIDNVGVSRHHATVAQLGSSYSIRDEGSANGVHVNGRKVSNQALSDGDLVQVGKFSLRLNLAGSGQTQLDAGARSISPPSRDMQKTFHLNASEVQRMVAEQRAGRVGSRADGAEPDNSLRILLVGLLAIVVLSVASYFMLIH
jgi:pSer/pThr/pTyr-binding forkhead associated (FHA) protein